MERLATRWKSKHEADAVALGYRASANKQTNPPSETSSAGTDKTPALWLRHNRSVRNKLINLAEEFQRRIRADESRIRFENRGNPNGNAIPSLLLGMKVKSTDDWAHRTEEIYRSTWEKQGHRETGSFIRAMSTCIVRLIHTRSSSIKNEFLRSAGATNFTNHTAYLTGFQLEMQTLVGRWQRRLESEALDLQEGERAGLHIFPQSAPGSPIQISTPSSIKKQSTSPMRPEGDSEQKSRETVIKKVQNPQAHTILSIREAALYFEVQPRSVYRWREAGELRSGARRGSITIESIEKWENKRSRKRRAR